MWQADIVVDEIENLQLCWPGSTFAFPQIAAVRSLIWAGDVLTLLIHMSISTRG